MHNPGASKRRYCLNVYIDAAPTLSTSQVNHPHKRPRLAPGTPRSRRDPHSLIDLSVITIEIRIQELTTTSQTSISDPPNAFMADSSVSSVGSEAVQPQLIEDEIAELKRKLEDAQGRLNAVTDAASSAFPSQPTVSNNGLSPHFQASTEHAS